MIQKLRLLCKLIKIQSSNCNRYLEGGFASWDINYVSLFFAKSDISIHYTLWTVTKRSQVEEVGAQKYHKGSDKGRGDHEIIFLFMVVFIFEVIFILRLPSQSTWWVDQICFLKHQNRTWNTWDKDFECGTAQLI